jgi:hypothetical protein
MTLAFAIAYGRAAAGDDFPLEERIKGREFPSVFQAWSPAEIPGEDRLVSMARHDLVFHGPEGFGLRWAGLHTGLATSFEAGSVEAGRGLRRRILDRNPRLVLIAEIRYRDAPRRWLPEGHRWWKRGVDGKPSPGWEEGGYLLLALDDPEFRAHVAEQCRAAVETGVVDGVMLDWWTDDADRLALAKVVRAAVGDKALILVNSNDRKIPATAPYINGLFLECYRSRTPEDWVRIAETLAWAEISLRQPRINCLETWWHRSADDFDRMRATTCLALTLSDGYCLFSDPNDLPTPDHRHRWYPFWDRGLGRPAGKGTLHPDGTRRRDFARGTAVYNPMGGAPARFLFDEERTSRATGRRAREHVVPPGDGDIFLR